VVEQGDLFFAFRRRVDAEHVHDLRDVQRFYLVLGSHQPREQFRVFIVGRKHLPEPGIGRGWAYNTLTTEDPTIIDEEMRGKDYSTKTRGKRHQHQAELAGEGAYRLLLRDDGASELVYALEQPEAVGPLQRELGIYHEGRLIIAVRNPDLGPLGGGRGHQPQFSAELRARFKSHRWLPVDDPHLLDYPYAQVILIASRTRLEWDQADPQTHTEVHRLLHVQMRRPLDDEPEPQLARRRVRKALDEQATVRPPRKLVCPMCGEGFETRSAYERHLLGAHPPRAPSAAELASALKGLHFPLSRDEIVAEAEKRPTDPRVVDLLKALPAEYFASVVDVTKALRELKSRLPG
jgi:hypothetical protein